MCALNLVKKTEIVDSYRSSLQDAKMAVLTAYSGSKVSDFDELRRGLRSCGAQCFVVKNTLLKRAVEGTSFEKLSENLEGPLALVILGDDIVGPAKVMDKFFSKAESKFRYVNALEQSREVVTSAQLSQLAKLPSREVLLGQLMGSLQAPVRNVMGVLKEVPRSLVYALHLVSRQEK